MKNRLCVNGVHCACSRVTLLIYPGGDGYFTWYDDDGSSFCYETGEY
jgi:Domain of unknown function (DUF5110)